jgi:hypothetical protein
MKKAILFLLLITGFGIQMFAQNYVDIAKFNYGYVPNVPMRDSDNTTDVHDVSTGVIYPIILSEKLAIITGVDFSDQVIKVSPDYSTLNLYSAGVRLGFSIKHSSKWNGLYVAIPKIAGDFGKVSGKDFQIGGVALWKYTKRENFTYKVGVYASTERFGLITIPIVGGYYLSSNKKFEANVSLPIAFDLNYKVAKPVRLGLDFNSIVRSYDLSESALSSFYIHRWMKELSVYVQFDFFKESLIFKARFVYAMNDFGLYEDGDQITLAVPATDIGDERVRLNKEMGSVVGVKASLVYRFHLSKPKEGNSGDKK